MFRVLIADDHPVVRNGLRTILLKSAEEIVVGEAGDGRGALDMVRAEQWDMVVLDINLPDLKGTEVLKRIREILPDLPILMYSLYTDHFTVKHALKAGASGYLSKEAVTEELVPAIEAIQSGKRYVSQALVERYDLNI